MSNKTSSVLGEVTYRWVVGEWSLLTTSGHRQVLSPAFTELTTATTWHLALYPRGYNPSCGDGDNDKSHDHLSLYLCFKSAGVVRARFSFAVMDQRGNQRHWKGPRRPYTFDNSTPSRTLRWGYDDFVTRATLSDDAHNLSDQVLTIVCQLWIESFQARPARNRFNYCWLLPQFLRNTHPRLESPVFSDANGQSQWRLVLHPNRDRLDDGSDEGYLSLYLALVSGESFPVKAYLSLVDSHSNCQYGMHFTHHFHSSLNQVLTPMHGDNIFGFNDFVQRSMLSEQARALLPNGQLTVFAEILLLDDANDLIGSEGSTESGVTTRDNCYTVMAELSVSPLVTLCYEWTLTLDPTHRGPQSTVFGDLSSGTKWQLTVYPCGKSITSLAHISLDTRLVSCAAMGSGRCTWSLLDAHRHEYLSASACFDQRLFATLAEFVSHYELLTSYPNCLLRDGRLTIRVCIQITDLETMKKEEP